MILNFFLSGLPMTTEKIVTTCIDFPLWVTLFYQPFQDIAFARPNFGKAITPTTWWINPLFHFYLQK